MLTSFDGQSYLSVQLVLQVQIQDAGLLSCGANRWMRRTSKGRGVPEADLVAAGEANADHYGQERQVHRNRERLSRREAITGPTMKAA